MAWAPELSALSSCLLALASLLSLVRRASHRTRLIGLMFVPGFAGCWYVLSPRLRWPSDLPTVASISGLTSVWALLTLRTLQSKSQRAGAALMCGAMGHPLLSPDSGPRGPELRSKWETSDRPHCSPEAGSTLNALAHQSRAEARRKEL